MAIEFVPAAGQYRDSDTKRFVPRTKVVSTVDEEVAKLKTALQGIARRLQSNSIDLEQFQKLVAERIKIGVLQAGAIGSGGMDQIPVFTYSAIDQRLRNRYGHLRNFAQDILAGEMSEKQFLNRVGQYSEVYRAVFYDAEKRQRMNLGFNQARRSLDPLAQHCPECIQYDTNGQWMRADQVVAPGTLCTCHGRCRCRIQYRRFVNQSLVSAVLG